MLQQSNLSCMDSFPVTIECFCTSHSISTAALLSPDTCLCPLGSVTSIQSTNCLSKIRSKE